MAWNDNDNLSKHTSHDRVFCYTSLKWWHLQGFFFIFSKFRFFGLLCPEAGRGRGEVTGQKMVQNDIKFCLTLYLSNCTSYECVFWYTCVKWWYLQQSFLFFQKSDFSGFSKFISEWQKEIMRCAQTSSHLCNFYCSGLLLRALPVGLVG